MKKSRVVVKIQGLNQERAINSIIKTIKVYNIKRENHNTCKLEVDFHNQKKLISLLNENNLEIINVSSQGVKWKFKRLMTSYGLIVAIILCAVFYFFQYNFIWQIKVVGEERLKEKEIVKFVEKELSSHNKSRINTQTIQKSLLENFEEISAASVAIVGQTLIININETILPEEMQTENKAILSQFDGLITDINLIQGTLAVDVGDIVKKGDVLVYPYIIDSQGKEREVFPKADIWADIWLCGKEVHYDYQIFTSRTGKEITLSEIYLWDLLIYSNGKVCQFKDFEKEEQSTYLCKNNILPFKLNKTTFYEIEIKEVVQDFYDVKDDIVEKARKKTLIFLQENEIIKEEKINIKEVGGVYEVNYLVTVNRNIGESYED